MAGPTSSLRPMQTQHSTRSGRSTHITHLQVALRIEQVAQLVVPHADALLDQVALGHVQLYKKGDGERACSA